MIYVFKRFGGLITIVLPIRVKGSGNIGIFKDNDGTIIIEPAFAAPSKVEDKIEYNSSYSDIILEISNKKELIDLIFSGEVRE